MTENNNNATLDNLDDLPVIVSVFGRDIGLAKDWDDHGEDSYVFYNFKPNELGKKWITSTDEKFLQAAEFSDNGGLITFYMSYQSGKMQYNWDKDKFVNLIPNWSAFT